MTTSRHTARHRHLRICREDAWGECPAEPAWQAVPVLGDGLKTAPAASALQPGDVLRRLAAHGAAGASGRRCAGRWSRWRGRR